MATVVLVLLILALVAAIVAAVLAHRARDLGTSFLSASVALWLLTAVLAAIPGR